MSPTQPIDRAPSGGHWIRVVLFALGAVMLASLAAVLLDPGLGTPDEARRTRHPAGFSFVPPRGWGGSVFYNRGDGLSLLRVSPERSTGRQPAIGVGRYEEPVKPGDAAKPGTFQGRPAFISIERTTHVHIWRAEFERDGVWYMVELSSPLKQDVEKSPLMPFLESFRIEPTFAMPTTLPGIEPTSNATTPTTAPSP